MKFMAYQSGGHEGLAIRHAERWIGLMPGEDRFPGTLGDLIGAEYDLSVAAQALLAGTEIDPAHVTVLPPLRNPPKIICIELNYRDHAAETHFEQPNFPTLFTRFRSTLIGHRQPIVRPSVSEQLDYEGEIVAIIGRGGKHIAHEDALQHIVGWTLFNDASVRDYQFLTPQWTIGKNFDSTGPMGPCMVTADELPPGAKDLVLETRLNGKVVQRASTNDMVFDPAILIETISQAMTLEPGDLIVTGTPAGVGYVRQPPLWMKNGDLIEVEVKGIGLLSNPVVDEL